MAPTCKCRKKPGDAIKEGQRLGLDELMIVNPGQPGTQAMFLGEDGTLYQIQGLGEAEQGREPGRFFLGEDGTLYERVR